MIAAYPLTVNMPLGSPKGNTEAAPTLSVSGKLFHSCSVIHLHSCSQWQVWTGWAELGPEQVEMRQLLGCCRVGLSQGAEEHRGDGKAVAPL